MRKLNYSHHHANERQSHATNTRKFLFSFCLKTYLQVEATKVKYAAYIEDQKPASRAAAQQSRPAPQNQGVLA